VLYQTTDGAGPAILTARSFGGLDVVFVSFSEDVSHSYPSPTPLDELCFNYNDRTAGGVATTIVSVSPIEDQPNQVKLQLSQALADTDVGVGGDQVSAADGAVFDLHGNLADSSHVVPVTADPQLAPASAAAISTTIIAAAAGGLGFLIIVIIITSVYCCRRHKRMNTGDGNNVRIELKDLSPDEIMAKFDVNKDGVLDAKELNNLMEKIVVTDKTKSSLEQQTKQSSDLHISIK